MSSTVAGQLPRAGGRKGDALIGRIVNGVGAPWRALAGHWGLFFQMLRQEILVSYARSVLGLYWIVLLPVFYVAVFIGVRFVALDKAGHQWIQEQSAPQTTLWSAFALTMGLLVFWLASEILTRGPNGVRKHATLATEVKFPLEVLPWVLVGHSVFNFLIRFLLLVVAYLVLAGWPHAGFALMPAMVLPLLTLMVGVAYVFAAVGVFLSDLEYVIQILMTALLLLSGVIFPLAMVPEPFRSILYLNPIAFTIEQVRLVGLDGRSPDWFGLGVLLVVGMIVSGLGYWFFVRTRPRFSDCL